MSRYATTLTLLFVLLLIGGFAIATGFNPEFLTQGTYVPSFSPDPQEAQTQALILVLGVTVIIASVIGMGVTLAIAFYQLTRMQAKLGARAGAPARPAPATAPAARGKGEAVPIPLSDTRSVAVFWVVLGLFVLGFLMIRDWGRPLGYIPNLLVTAPAATPPTSQPGDASAGTGGVQAELAALPPGDAAAGQAVFTSAGCAACHSLEPNVKVVGPSLAGVAARAAERKPGYSAELYIYESITLPNTHVVEGFQADIMPKTFKQTLQPQDLANLIAFLMTEK